MHILPALTKLKVVDHIKLVIGFILRVDFLVKLFSHVLFESSVVTECSLTIQTLQAEEEMHEDRGEGGRKEISCRRISTSYTV